MNILIGTDVYFPSLGGQQIVVQQIAERLVKFGHSVTVATGALENRSFTELNGVIIKEFAITGSFVHGLKGQVKEYCKYVANLDFDVLMIKAAQGWTVDALLPVLGNIKMRKIFIPCGFSFLYDPFYKEYYRQMPKILQQFDHLIFYASDYRDINFVKKNKSTNYSIIPNGASGVEFSIDKDLSFRDRLNISKDDFIFLTVGSFTGGKGHLEITKAYQLAKFRNPTTLILNGNQPHKHHRLAFKVLLKEYAKMGPLSMLKRIYNNFLIKTGIRKENVTKDWNDIAHEVNGSHSDKKIIITNLDRKDLIQAFLNSNLFVFASNIEYSPLVLFESAAAGLPFLTVPVGNSKEIIEWTAGGELCPAPINKNGRTTVDPRVLANKMSELSEDPIKLKKLGISGKENWKNYFTWDKIARQYEQVLMGNYN